MTQRLPTVNSDDGTWGTLLNDFIGKEHDDISPGTPDADSGRHKNITIRAGTDAVGGAPLKFTSGALTTGGNRAVGAMEFSSDVLYLTITGPTRKTIAFTDSNFVFSTTSKTGDYTITTADTVVLVDANGAPIAITLPLASSASGYRFFVKKIDSTANAVTLTRSGSDTIDGSTTAAISVQYTSLTVLSNGTNWFIV